MTGPALRVRPLTRDTAMTGLAGAFRAAGSNEVARPRGDRPVLRYDRR